MSSTTHSQKIKVIYGTFFFGKLEIDEVKEQAKVLEHHGVHDLDTASEYKGSELTIGNVLGTSRFTIHTKAPGFVPGCLSSESIEQAMRQSLADLGVQQVETLILHTPDRDTPIVETLTAIQRLHAAGTFKAFGLSNHLPAQVAQIHSLCSSQGCVLPTIYQGNFNPVARRAEDELLPLLRKLGMSFYAYSPLAGGFLAHSAEDVENGTHKRFDKSWWLGKMYSKLYARPRLLAALPKWHKIASDAGCTPTELAYRWVGWNSSLSADRGDAMIVGASSARQLEQTLTHIEAGPLPESVVAKIDQLWTEVQDEAPLDDYHY